MPDTSSDAVDVSRWINWALFLALFLTTALSAAYFSIVAEGGKVLPSPLNLIIFIGLASADVALLTTRFTIQLRGQYHAGNEALALQLREVSAVVVEMARRFDLRFDSLGNRAIEHSAQLESVTEEIPRRLTPTVAVGVASVPYLARTGPGGAARSRRRRRRPTNPAAPNGAVGEFGAPLLGAELRAYMAGLNDRYKPDAGAAS